MKREHRGNAEVLVSVTPFGRRAAVVDGRGRVVSFYVEVAGEESQVGDIWRGRVSRPVSGHDAVFVELGGGVEAMLPEHGEPGQMAVVQITRDGFANKGPRVTTEVEFAGRLLVYRPNGKTDNTARELRDPAERERIATLLGSIERPSGSFTARSLAEGADIAPLAAEAKALIARAEGVTAAAGSGTTADEPARLADAGGLVGRLLRETAPPGAGIHFDDRDACDAAIARARAEVPSLAGAIGLAGDKDLFERHDVDTQWATALGANVPLGSGGRLIIEETAACVAIDVDAGTGARRGAQEKASREAVEAAAGEIILRNLAGLIAIDLPGDVGRRTGKELAAAMRKALRADRVSADVLGVSHAGVMEVTRRRVGPSLMGALTEEDTSMPWPARRWQLAALAFEVARRARIEWVAGARGLIIRAAPPLARMLAKNDPIGTWLTMTVTIEPDAALSLEKWEVRTA